MSDSVRALRLVLQSRQLDLDTTAIKLLNDDQLIRLWNADGDLIFYNDTMKKVMSYSPLDLCYYDLKTLWSFQNDGYEIFKNVVMRAIMGRDLASQRSYEVRENQGLQYGARQVVELAVPIFSGDKVDGILIAGQTEVRKPA